jgi:hypothetical protein
MCPAARPLAVNTGLATLGTGYYVPHHRARRTVAVSQSFVRLISYVVLAAIILATGFGAF